MKYAGLLNPPPKMTQDVYEYALSEYAKVIVKDLKEYEKSLKNYRMEKNFLFEPILESIDRLRSALDNEGTRKVFQAYKDFFERSLGRFGYGYASEYKMKTFSGIKDKSKREKVKDLVEKNIDAVLVGVESRLSWGERLIPEVKKIMKEYRKLILKGAKGKSKKLSDTSHIKSFPVNLDGWEYFNQYSMEGSVDSRTQSRIKEYEEEIEDREYNLRNVDTWLAGLPPQKKERRIQFTREFIEELKEDIERLKSGENRLRYGHVQVQVDIGGSGNSFYGAGRRLMRIKLKRLDVENFVTFSKIKSVKRETYRIVVHEMTHVAQSLLSFLTEKNQMIPGYVENRGVPSKKIRTPQFDQHRETSGLSSWESHNLDDVEFYTDLRDAIGRIMEHINIRLKGREKDIENGWSLQPLDQKEKLEIFKHYVGQPNTYSRYSDTDPFFKSLKRLSKPKYNKAVGEAYKVVFNSRHTPRFAKEIIMNRKSMAKRIARVHLERGQWTETSNRNFDKEQEQELWTLYDIAYSQIGKHIGSKNELIKKYPVFEVIDIDDDPDIDIFIAMKKTPFGKKVASMGHDGTRESKKAVVLKMLELLKTPGYYTEASDKIEEIIRRGGVDNIKDEAVVEKIMTSLGKTDLIFEGDGYYNRSLGSIGRKTKALFGNPKI